MFNEKTNKYEGSIYCITNRMNLKMYIGQTTIGVNNRFENHKKKSRDINRSIHLYSDARDFGWDIFDVFEIEKIECDSLDELKSRLDEKEIFYISDYNTSYPNGYNISDGGWMLPNMIPACKVYKFDLDGNLVAEYGSMIDAARNNFVSQADISNCCNGKKVVTVGGFYWSKKPEFPIDKKYKMQKTMVAAYDSDGNFIKKFNSIREAADEMLPEFKHARHSISACCRNINKTAYGYIWRYC